MMAVEELERAMLIVEQEQMITMVVVEATEKGIVVVGLVPS